MELRIKRAPRIDIEITVPGDKSISHRAVIIAAMSNGPRHCTASSDGCEHCRRRAGANVATPHPWRLPTWNSLSSARCERAGQKRFAAGGPLCQGQDYHRGTVT